MLLRKPYIKLVGEEKTPVIQKFEERFTEEDLVFDLGNDEVPFDADEVKGTGDFDVKDNDLDWLSQL